MSIVSQETEGAVPIKLNYYLVSGARKFGINLVYVTFTNPVTVESVSDIFVQHYIAEAARLNKIVHPEAVPEVTFKTTGNFGSRAASTLQNYINTFTPSKSFAFEVKVNPQAEINASFYDRYLKEQEEAALTTVELQELKDANSDLVLTETLWLTWLEMINSRRATMTIIPDSILPYIGRSEENSLIAVEIAEEIAQFVATRLKSVRQELMNYQDAIEQKCIREVESFIVSIGKRRHSHVNFTASISRLYSRL
ncbi:hypothetical protein RCL1_006185 [Eukaryota sp. TZLM3-RCL]